MRKKFMAGGCAVALALCPMAGMGESLSGGTVIIKNPDNSAVAQPLNSATSGAALVIPLSSARGTLRVEISGLTASGATLSIYSSRDNAASFQPKKAVTSAGYLPTVSADGPVDIDAAGLTDVEFVVSTVGSGTITVSYNSSAAVGFVIDPNNASYVNAFAMTVGSTYAAGRALQVDCPTAGGAIVMDLASGQQDTLNVVSSAQSQFFPFSLTEVVSGPSGCTYHDLP
jgi:hypothetical protein